MSPSAHPQDGVRENEREGLSSDQNSNTRSQAQVVEPGAPRTEHELAQAFRDLARGEQAATALEVNLTNLESKLDELLASFEDAAGGLPVETIDGGDQSGSGGKRQANPQPRSNGQDTTKDR